MSLHNIPPPTSLGIALGANLPSSAGSPKETLIAVRPQLEIVICEWIAAFLEEKSDRSMIYKELCWQWSPLFETKPIGGPKNQPSFINAVGVINGSKLSLIKPSEKKAIDLLERCLALERDYGRNRKDSSEKWGPRSIDIDLLAWGDLQVKNEKLVLPHPRLIERDFVVVPLAAAVNKGINRPRQIKPDPKWTQ